MKPLLAPLVLLALLTPQLATAQQPADDRPTAGRAGYDDVPTFGGPRSVGVQLRDNDAVREPVFRFDTLQGGLKPWFDTKQRLNRERGLSYAADYQVTGQAVSDSLSATEALGGVFRVYGSWTLAGRGTANTGALVAKVENRHAIGTEVPPQNLGLAAGAAAITGTFFSDIGWALTNLYWQQKFAEGRVGLVAGQVDATDYLDLYGMTNPLSSFSNLAFSLNPAIAAPNQGIGAAAGGYLGDKAYVLGGFADANGDATRPGFDSILDDGELFKHLEVGWTPSFEQRYLDNVHLMAWHADERKSAGVEDSWGLAFSAARFVDEQWMPFLRAGWSEGNAAIMETSVSVGLGRYVRRRSDLVGLGFNWGRPNGGLRQHQYIAELFYRLQLSPNFALTPDLQLIVEPANNLDTDAIGLVGLRGRLTL